MKIPHYIGTTEADTKLELHEDAITQGFADFGKRGRGKSNLLGCMAETFAQRKQSFVILDPPDAHWGIRFEAGEDGRPCGPSGLNVLIVGGDHGDVTLDPNGGKDLAKTIVDGDISAVICMKSMGYTAQQRFCADFGEELFRTNRTPRHIFFEEAHNFLPQNLKFEEQKRVLYAMLKIITDGRGCGLGFTLASQRPAEVSKTALEEVDNFFALGMIGPNDLKTIGDWFKHHVSREKGRLESIVDDIAKMKPGECWFLSPEWMKEIVKFHVRFRVTYHAGRTPKPGESAISTDKFSVTEAVQKLKELFAAKQVEQRQEVVNLNDAKKRIRELEAEIRKKDANVNKSLPAVNEKALTKHAMMIEHRVHKEMDAKLAIVHADAKALRAHGGRLAKALAELATAAAKQFGGEAPKLPAVQWGSQAKEYREATLKSNVHETTQRFFGLKESPGDDNHHEVNGKLRAGAERMLAALAQWSPNGMTYGQLRAHAGLKKSGTFSTYRSELRSGRYIEERGEMVFATDKALEYCQHTPEAPRTTEDVLGIWNPKLRDGARRMLAVLVEAGGEAITKEDLASKSSLTNSGTFSTYLAELKTSRLAIVQQGMVAANKESLFL